MNDVLRASVWTGLATAIRALSLLVIAKLIAIYVGPEGMGRIGQFLSLMAVLTVLAGGGIANGLIRYIAQNQTEPNTLDRYVRTGLTLTLLASLATGVLGFVFNRSLSVALFETPDMAYVVQILCLLQFFIAGHNFLVAVINGHRNPKRFAIVNVAGTLVGLAITAFLTRSHGLNGALIGLMLLQALPFLFSLVGVGSAPWFRTGMFGLSWESQKVRQLLHYSGMAIASTTIVPISHILLRGLIEDNFGWSGVSYWQAATRISDVFMMFVTMTLTAYYLPRVSEANSDEEIRLEVAKMFKVLLPLLGAGALLLYVLRAFIIRILFSEAFAPVEGLLGPQFIGDLLRISAWILAYLMLAKSMTALFIVTELATAFVVVASSSFPVESMGIVGVIWSSTIASGLYLLTMALVLRRYHGLGRFLSSRAAEKGASRSHGP